MILSEKKFHFREECSMDTENYYRTIKDILTNEITKSVETENFTNLHLIIKLYKNYKMEDLSSADLFLRNDFIYKCLDNFFNRFYIYDEKYKADVENFLAFFDILNESDTIKKIMYSFVFRFIDFIIFNNEKLESLNEIAINIVGNIISSFDAHFFLKKFDIEKLNGIKNNKYYLKFLVYISKMSNNVDSTTLILKILQQRHIDYEKNISLVAWITCYLIKNADFNIVSLILYGLNDKILPVFDILILYANTSDNNFLIPFFQSIIILFNVQHNKNLICNYISKKFNIQYFSDIIDSNSNEDVIKLCIIILKYLVNLFEIDNNFIIFIEKLCFKSSFDTKRNIAKILRNIIKIYDVNYIERILHTNILYCFLEALIISNVREASEYIEILSYTVQKLYRKPELLRGLIDFIRENDIISVLSEFVIVSNNENISVFIQNTIRDVESIIGVLYSHE